MQNLGVLYGPGRGLHVSMIEIIIAIGLVFGIGYFMRAQKEKSNLYLG